MSANANIAALLYLVAGSLFILALKGLSSPASSRAGNRNGMIGMTIAVLTTLWISGVSDPLTWALVIGGLGIGGAIGAVMAKRIAMTNMPQLVAAFHSLVGLAAVLTAGAALYSPEAFHIGSAGAIHAQSLVEMSLGVAIGAITFSGSVIAFAKLNGNMSGAPIILPARHLLNLLIFLVIIGLVAWFTMDQAHWMFWAITALSLLFGITLIIPIGGADMPVVVSMLNSYSGWAAAALGFTLENSALIITGALVGSSGAILSYIMCKGMNRSFISVIAGGFGGDTGPATGVKETRPVKQGSADDAAFIAITIAGGAIFLRYSLGRYLRFWLLRQIHEQRVQTDRLVAVLGRRAGEGGAVVESDATASADWPRVWPGPPGQAGPAGDATADPPQDAPPNAGGGDAPEK